MMRAVAALVLVSFLAVGWRTVPAYSQEDASDHVPSDGAAATDEQPTDGLAIVDTPNLHVAVKNVRQKDESGDSRFGVGLDWRYSFEKQVPPVAGPDALETVDPNPGMSLAYNLSLSGKGFTSLGDSQTSHDEAKDASNFNSITNRLRYASFFRAIGPRE